MGNTAAADGQVSICWVLWVFILIEVSLTSELFTEQKLDRRVVLLKEFLS